MNIEHSILGRTDDILTSFNVAGRITKFAFVSPQSPSPSSWASASIAPSPWRRGESFNATARTAAFRDDQQWRLLRVPQQQRRTAQDQPPVLEELRFQQCL